VIEIRSSRISLFAGACGALVWILLNCQVYLEQTPARPFKMSYPLFVSECFYLTPLVAVILFRHSMVTAVSYASTLSLILVGRFYYFSQVWSGRVSGFGQKFDWADLLLMVLSTISLVLIFGWILVRVVSVIARVLRRH
jgi:hypothetical protein